MSELEKAARNGDLYAIEEYVKELIQKNKYTEAQSWCFKGCSAGSYWCMEMYGHLTVMSVHALVQISSSEAARGLQELKEAEQWITTAQEAGKLQDGSVLCGKSGIYSGMTWCNYLLAIQTRDLSYYKGVMGSYLKIAERQMSRDKYAYMDSLGKTGDVKKQIEVAKELYNEYDDTLQDYMLEVICANLCQAYLDGKIVEPDYQEAYKYAKELYKINPEENSDIYNSFLNGEVQKDFNRMHGGSAEQSNSGQSGCYIATAVYGSYDCPEVWTLRRFRDNTLAANVFGKMFIKSYYAVSPTLVKFWGNQKWFNIFWKGILDKFVNKLNNQGVENTYYRD